MSGKTRIEFVDLAKGFCILLVVFYHITDFYKLEIPFGDFFKAFRLPLYFFLSGMFFKEYSGLWNFCKRKINKLLIPFLFWLLMSFVLAYFVNAFGVKMWTSFLYKPISVTLVGVLKGSYPNAPIWFLLCLFEVNILFYVCLKLCSSNLNKTIQIIFFSFMLASVGILLWWFHIRLPLNIDSSFTALPFFMFGYVISRKTNLLTPQKWDKYLPFLIILFFSIVCVYSPFYSLKNNNLNKFAVITMYPCGLLGTLGVIFLSKWIKYIPVIVWWGRYSIMLLVSHVYIYYFIASVIPYFSRQNSSWGVLSLNMLITLCICSILIPFYKRYLPYVTAQKDLIPV